MALLTRYVLPKVVHQVARSQELLVLFGVAYAVSVATLSDFLGFSTEVGAFLAGVSLATTPYRDALGARLVSLRDFLLLFFFLELGARLGFTDASQQLIGAAIFSIFVLVGNPLIVVLIMAAMRYPMRVGLLAGAHGGADLRVLPHPRRPRPEPGPHHRRHGQLDHRRGPDHHWLLDLPHLYSHPIYARLERWLSPLERSDGRKRDLRDPEEEADVILYGLGRLGGAIADQLSRAGHRVLAVDFDPHRVARNDRDGVTADFGSADDMHLLENLPLSRARRVICTIPLLETSRALLHGPRHHDYQGKVALTAHSEHDAEQLDSAGADVILRVFLLAAMAAAEVLDQLLGRGEQRGPSGTPPP